MTYLRTAELKGCSGGWGRAAFNLWLCMNDEHAQSRKKLCCCLDLKSLSHLQEEAVLPHLQPEETNLGKELHVQLCTAARVMKRGEC